jgi:phosphomannomutase
MTQPVLAQARAWRDDDPDPDTARALDAVVERAADGDATATADLQYAFSGRITFGTAGLRAPMGWGPRRMNRATVGRAAAGFGDWLLAERSASPAVVVGYDARHGSDVFARDTVEILAGLGIEALLLPRALPTPVLAFSLGALDATAGIMVTASHNPAGDNGYKVYVGRQQIAPPLDEQIAAHIDAVPSVKGCARSDGWTLLDNDVVEHYVERAASLVDPSSPREVRVVYTPLHGVAGDVALDVLHRGGFNDVHVVGEQFTPDPDFPTISSPNPEHAQTLHAAIAMARSVDADLVIATDPDGDRCAVAVPDSATEGGWRRLTGNEVGDLLGQWLADDTVPGAFATTLVSSSRLGAIAAAHGRTFVRTLTGFKWLATVPSLRYAYEEAIGYCVDPHAVRDKDGITAALRVVELAATLHASGQSLLDALADLDQTFGRDLTDYVVASSDDIGRARILLRLREFARQPPRTLAGLGVRAVTDLDEGFAGMPPTPGLLITLDGPTAGSSAQVVIRPSGTEPIVKAYLEVVDPPRAEPILLPRQQDWARPEPTARDSGHTEDTAPAALNRLRAEVSVLLG